MSTGIGRRAVLAGLVSVVAASMPLLARAQDQVIEPETTPTPTEPSADANPPAQVIEPSDPQQPAPTPVDSQAIDVPATVSDATESSLYFASTGHNLSSPFLTIWQDAGGETLFGQPLSEGRFVDATAPSSRSSRGSRSTIRRSPTVRGRSRGSPCPTLW